MEICIKDGEFNPSLLYQKGYNKESVKLLGYSIVEIADDYLDCEYTDFDFNENNFILNLEKYNARKKKLLEQAHIPEIKQRLNELSQDFVQVQLGAVIENIDERKTEFIELHNELRGLLGKSPREYKE